MDGDLFMRTGEDFGLGVLAVIDKGFMDAAERRSAVHRQIVEIERLEHIDHEIAAARCLIHGILRGRQGLDRDLRRPGNGRLEVLLWRGNLRTGRKRRSSRRPDEARTAPRLTLNTS